MNVPLPRPVVESGELKEPVKGQRAQSPASIDVFVAIADNAARDGEGAYGAYRLRGIDVVLTENKCSSGRARDGGQILFLGEAAGVQRRVAFHQIDLRGADQSHGQVDGSEGIVKAQTAGAVIADFVRTGADGVDYTAAFGKIVGRGGDRSAAIGSENACFTIGHAIEVAAEVVAFELIDVLSIEAGVGEISLGDETRNTTAAATGSAASTEQKRNQAQEEI